MILYNELTSRYLIKRFPEFEERVVEEMLFLEEELPHCIYANVLNPFLREYFRDPVSENTPLAERIFGFYEELAENGDEEAVNLLETSLLEVLWDHTETYYGALKMMGEKTKAHFESLSSYLNKPKGEPPLAFRA